LEADIEYSWWIDLIDSFRFHRLKVELLFLPLIERFSYQKRAPSEEDILVNTNENDGLKNYKKCKKTRLYLSSNATAPQLFISCHTEKLTLSASLQHSDS